MSARKQRAMWVGAIGSAVVAGAAAGFGAERKVVRSRRQMPEPASAWAAAPKLDRECSVAVGDDTILHVEEVGPRDAAVSMVFLHGFTQGIKTWRYQRDGLMDLCEQGVRLIFVDQRGHGMSTHGPSESRTIEQLGKDVRVVLDEVVPTGDIILVGHSMGGMTVMAFAETSPEMFEDRVIGVALISTSAGHMAEVTFGLPPLVGKALTRLSPKVWALAGRRAGFIEGLIRSRSDLSTTAIQRIGFGSADKVPPSMVDQVAELLDETSIQSIASFMPTFLSHNRLAALKVLAEAEVLVLVGDCDMVTPLEHSQAIARFLPHAKLVVLPGAGHIVIMERAPLVNLHLKTLVQRARARAKS